MPPVAAAEIPAPAVVEPESPLVETVRELPEEGQRAVLSDALFLRHQEAERIAADNAEWDRLLNDPEKMANFAKWAQASAAQHPDEPFDYSRL